MKKPNAKDYGNDDAYYKAVKEYVQWYHTDPETGKWRYAPPDPFKGYHPIWDILKIAVILGFATWCLKITATDFDASELQALSWMGAGGAGWYIAKYAKPVWQWLMKKRG